MGRNSAIEQLAQSIQPAPYESCLRATSSKKGTSAQSAYDTRGSCPLSFRGGQQPSLSETDGGGRGLRYLVSPSFQFPSGLSFPQKLFPPPSFPILSSKVRPRRAVRAPAHLRAASCLPGVLCTNGGSWLPEYIVSLRSLHETLFIDDD